MEELKHFLAFTNGNDNNNNHKEEEEESLVVVIVSTALLGLLVLLVISMLSVTKTIIKSVVQSPLWAKQQQQQSLPSKPSSRSSTERKREEICQCPFSKESSFVVETAEDLLEPTPLDRFDDYVNWWERFQTKNNHQQQQRNNNKTMKKQQNQLLVQQAPPKYLGLRWLAYGVSGQDHPGYLRAQLQRFRHHKHFLLVDHHLLREELDLKDKWLGGDYSNNDSTNTNNTNKQQQQQQCCFVMEEDSLQAQQETLELFLAYLPKRYPNIYKYDEDNHSITVYDNNTTAATTDDDENDHSDTKKEMTPPILRTYRIADWWDKRPLELCSRIVQEDLILMRHSPTTKSYNMAAASVVFSFTELEEKLSTDTNFIHAPVPNFQQHLAKVLYVSFQSLKVEKPLWRNNWTIVPTGRLDEPSDTYTHKQEIQHLQALQHPRERYLKVEYQTIRRLPRNSQYLLFTVRTFTDPMSALEEEDEEEDQDDDYDETEDDPNSSVASSEETEEEEEEAEEVPEKMMMVRAAETLASSIRGLSLETLQYKGIESKQTKENILNYLDSIAARNKNKNITASGASRCQPMRTDYQAR